MSFAVCSQIKLAGGKKLAKEQKEMAIEVKEKGKHVTLSAIWVIAHMNMSSCIGPATAKRQQRTKRGLSTHLNASVMKKECFTM